MYFQNSGTVTVSVPEAAGAPAVTPGVRSRYPGLASRQLQSNVVPENNMVQPHEDVKSKLTEFQFSCLVIDCMCVGGGFSLGNLHCTAATFHFFLVAFLISW